MSISPPRPKGPPLNALRAFEAAARLGGFALAADELSVTPGAISQHIKTLEDWAGTSLFERRSQGVRLTPAGARLAPAFTTAFDQLGAAVRNLRTAAPRKTLHLAALPSVAQLWLSPRLPRLRMALPHLNFSVSALETPPNLDREQYDLSVFLTEPSHSSAEIILEPDHIFPVCAPDVADRLRTPSDLEHMVLLHDEVWADDWQRWSDAAGLSLKGQSEGFRFSLYSIALEEAKNGAGILMGHKCLVDEALLQGTLIRPFDLSVPTGKALVMRLPATHQMSADTQQVVSLLQ